MKQRKVLVAATGVATVIAAGLAGCGVVPGSAPTRPASPTQAVSTPAVTPSAPVTPTVSATTPSSTPAAALVEATGQLSFYRSNLVSKALVGTCKVVAGAPTVTLADRRNDFYTTVDLTIVLAADGGAVTRIAGDFGEDSELITWKLEHPAKGTSAKLAVSGGEYRISGKAMLYESGTKTGTLVPYSIVATCASTGWLD